MKQSKKSYFVYLNLCTRTVSKEVLYANELTYEQAQEEWKHADEMLDWMYQEYSCRSACIGNVNESSDYYVANRLGLI